MHKFFHDEPGQIVGFLKDGWSIHLCDVAGAWQRQVEPSFIAAYCEQTLSYWGASPSEYILAAKQNLPRNTGLVPLFNAFRHACGDLIMLVGYNDGGLVSVSKVIWPFQRGTEQAPWWQPFDRHFSS